MSMRLGRGEAAPNLGLINSARRARRAGMGRAQQRARGSAACLPGMSQAAEGEQPLETTGAAESRHEAAPEGESPAETAGPSTRSQTGDEADLVNRSGNEEDAGYGLGRWWEWVGGLWRRPGAAWRESGWPRASWAHGTGAIRSRSRPRQGLHPPLFPPSILPSSWGWSYCLTSGSAPGRSSSLRATLGQKKTGIDHSALIRGFFNFNFLSKLTSRCEECPGSAG